MTTMTGAWVDWFDRYRYLTRTTATVAFATVPLVLIYGLGLLVASPLARSGVDIVSVPILRHLPVASYIGIQLAIAGVLIFVAAFRREETVGSHLRWTFPTIAESAAWGFGTGTIVIAALDEVLVLSAGAGDAAMARIVDLAVLSAGAGLHEEFVFRLVLIPLLVLALTRVLGVERWAAALGAIALSSVIFALAHHLAGEPFDTYVFAFRTVAGIFFAALFTWRGFAIAAWSHAIYDLQVLAAANPG